MRSRDRIAYGRRALCPKKGGESQARYKYKLQLIAEICTGQAQRGFVSDAMNWGVEQETFARAAYEIKTGLSVDLVGFYIHPQIDQSGASPDGVVGKDGSLEIKCPNTATHLDYMLAGVVPEEYQPQMLWQMACTGRKWCDFVSYDPRLPEHLQLFMVRFQRDDARIAEYEAAVRQFLSEVDSLMLRLPAPNGDTAFVNQLHKSLEITEQDVRHANPSRNRSDSGRDCDSRQGAGRHSQLNRLRARDPRDTPNSTLTSAWNALLAAEVDTGCATPLCTAQAVFGGYRDGCNELRDGQR